MYFAVKHSMVPFPDIRLFRFWQIQTESALYLQYKRWRYVMNSCYLKKHPRFALMAHWRKKNSYFGKEGKKVLEKDFSFFMQILLWIKVQINKRSLRKVKPNRGVWIVADTLWTILCKYQLILGLWITKEASKQLNRPVSECAPIHGSIQGPCLIPNFQASSIPSFWWSCYMILYPVIPDFRFHGKPAKVLNFMKMWKQILLQVWYIVI